MKTLATLTTILALAIATAAFAQTNPLAGGALATGTPTAPGTGTLAPGTIANIAKAVNDDATARAERAAAPQFNVFVSHTSDPLTLTAAEIVATYGGQTIFVQPAKNGAQFKSCTQFEEFGTVLWNTGGAASERRLCLQEGISFIPGTSAVITTGGQLSGFRYDNGSGFVVVSVPAVANSAPAGMMSVFVQ